MSLEVQMVVVDSLKIDDHSAQHPDFTDFETDYLTDSEFQELYNLDPLVKKEADDIENLTVQIFARLAILTDEQKRSDIEAAVSTVETSTLSQGSTSDSTKSVLTPDIFNSQMFGASLKLRPFRKDTNFFDEDPTVSLQTHQVANNIFSTLGKILFGYEAFDSSRDNRSINKMKEDLRDDHLTWNTGLSQHYQRTFNLKMDFTFNQAEKILKVKQKIYQSAYYQRITLYAFLILSSVGKLISQRLVTVLGLVASSITLIFMLTKYGTNSMQLAQLTSDLKRSLESVEKEACKYRIYP